MVKEEKTLFLRTFLLIIGILVVEAGVMFFIYRPSNMVGFSVIDVEETFSKIYPSSKLFLFAQWSLIFLVLSFIFFKDRGVWKRKGERAGINVEAYRKKSKTNLDALYLILKEKKQLSVKSISILFEIKTDLALEWARILESGELVTVEYPGFGSPVVILKDKKKEGEGEDKKGGEEVKGKEKKGNKGGKEEVGEKKISKDSEKEKGSVEEKNKLEVKKDNTLPVKKVKSNVSKKSRPKSKKTVKKKSKKKGGKRRSSKKKKK